MALADSLLSAIVRADGDALVMHVGERPYVVVGTQTINISTHGLNLESMTGMLAQLLPPDAQTQLEEFGAVEHKMQFQSDDRFTVVAARGGDDIWIEIRRRRAQPAQVAAAAPEPVVEAPPPAPVVAEAPPPVVAEIPPPVAPAVQEAVILNAQLAPLDVAPDPQPASPHGILESFVEERRPVVDCANAAEPLPAVEPNTEPQPAEHHEIAAAVTPAPETYYPPPVLIPPPQKDPEPEQQPEPEPQPEPIAAPALEAATQPEPAPEPEPEKYYPPPVLIPPPPPDPEPVPVAIETISPSPTEEVPDPVTASAPEPTIAPEPEPQPEPVVVLEPVIAAAPELVSESKPLVPMEPESVIAPEPVISPEPVIAPEPVIVPEPEPIVAVEPEPIIAAVPEPVTVTEPMVVETSQPEPIVADAPFLEPMVAEVPAPVVARAPEPEAMPIAASIEREVAPEPEPAAPVAPAATVVPMTRTVRIEVPPRAPAATHARSTDIERLLRIVAARGASTLFLTSESRPWMRLDGDLRQIESEPVLSRADVQRAVLEIAPESGHASIGKGEPTEWISEFDEIGRIRCTTFVDHRGPGVLLRMIATRAATAEQLGLAREVQDLATESQGLILVAGPRGSGKSTVMSALVDLVNKQRAEFIITLERQIRLVHDNKNALVSQREIRGGAEESLAAARAALRENPDVLVVDDLVSPQMVPLLLTAASDGLLIFVTITAPSTADAVQRFIELAPPEMQKAVQSAMSESFRGAVAQVLVKKIGGGLVAPRELMLATTPVMRVIGEGQLDQLPLVFESGRKHGMVSFTDALAEQVRAGAVDARDAFRKAPDKNRLLERLKRDGVDISDVEKLA